MVGRESLTLGPIEKVAVWVEKVSETLKEGSRAKECENNCYKVLSIMLFRLDIAHNSTDREYKVMFIQSTQKLIKRMTSLLV